MKLIWILPVLLGTVAPPSLATANENFAQQSRGEHSITVYKERRELWLFRGDTLTKIYPVFLGSKPGDKQKRGDNRTPEGDYRVVEKKKSDKFHRFLGIDYPNLKDANRAYGEGRLTADQWVEILHANTKGLKPPWNTPLGGFLGIHGIGEDESFKLRLIGNWDWTNGCVALRNRDVEELFRRIPLGTVVRIRK